MWKEIAVALYEVPIWYFDRGNEENHEDPATGRTPEPIREEYEPGEANHSTVAFRLFRNWKNKQRRTFSF
jgi:hypothetical protein